MINRSCTQEPGAEESPRGTKASAAASDSDVELRYEDITYNECAHQPTALARWLYVRAHGELNGFAMKHIDGDGLLSCVRPLAALDRPTKGVMQTCQYYAVDAHPTLFGLRCATPGQPGPKVVPSFFVALWPDPSDRLLDVLVTYDLLICARQNSVQS